MLNSNTHTEVLKQHNIITTGLALAVGAAAVLLDQTRGAHENAMHRSTPEFHTTYKPGAEHTLGVLPGCQTDSRVFFEHLTPYAHNTNVVMASYPERALNVNEICEGLGAQLLDMRAEKPSLLCQSMGGMVMRHFLHYAHESGLAERLGGFGDIVLDSSPFDRHDVQTPYRLLLDATKIGRTSWAADHLKRLINRPTIHIETIYNHGKFIYANHPTDPLPDIMDSVRYIQGPNDNVINTTAAAAKYERIVPAGKFQVITDTSRPDHSHTADIPRYGFELHFAGVPVPDYSAA